MALSALVKNLLLYRFLFIFKIYIPLLVLKLELFLQIVILEVSQSGAESGTALLLKISVIACRCLLSIANLRRVIYIGWCLAVR